MDTKQVLKAMSREEKLALICGVGNNSTLPIRVLPSLKIERGGLFGGGEVRFPYPVAIACSWDEHVAYEIGCEKAKQCCANGVHVTAEVPPLLPFSDPEDGDRYRYISSDERLTRVLASAFTEGVQSTGVGVCAPIVCSGTALTSAQRQLMKPVLCGDGDTVCKPRAILAYGGGNDGNYIRSLGFDGCIVSEWGTVGDRAAALNGGIDLSMPEAEGERESLASALNGGRLLADDKPEKSAERVLELIDETFDDHAYGLNRSEQLKKSVLLAAECVVMLKNDSILPISGDRVTFVGKGARALCVAGEDGDLRKISLPDAFSSDRRVRFIEGDAEEILKQTLPDETVIVVFGQKYSDCIGNRRDRGLDERLLRTVERLEESDRNVVAVVTGGGEADLFRVSAAKGLIYAPYLGDGAARALKKIICGEISPSGRLAEDFYTFDKDGKRRVLYPFGFGLSYGSFSYKDIRFEDSEGKDRILTEVSNDGGYTAADTIQIYADNISGERKLVAFEKVRLRARESRTVIIRLPNLDGIGQLLVGTSKSDIIAKISIADRGCERSEISEKTVTATVKSQVSSFGVSTKIEDAAETSGGKWLLKRIGKVMLKKINGDKERAERLTIAASRLPFGALTALTGGAVSAKTVKAALLWANGRYLKAFAAFLKKH